MDKTFFAENRKKVIDAMADQSCLIMFSGSPPVATADEYYAFQPDRKTFDNFVQLAVFLEELLGRKVEVVTTDALSPYLGPHILEEVEYVSLSS